MICFINKEISEEKLSCKQVHSSLALLCWSDFYGVKIHMYLRIFFFEFLGISGDFSDEINQIDFASIEGKLPFVVRSA